MYSIKIQEIVPNESIEEYLARCSSVVHGSQPKSPQKLLKRLLRESIGDKPSRILEYVPVTMPLEEVILNEKTFGVIRDQQLITNMREGLSLMRADSQKLFTYKDLLSMINFDNYFVVKATAPYFVYGQISTHTQLTSVSHSNRYGESKVHPKYYLPQAIESKNVSQEKWDDIVDTSSPEELVSYMKHSGCYRREVFARGSDMLRYREFTLGGYVDEWGWIHFVQQRTDYHTQFETQFFADQIKTMIEEKYNGNIEIL
jgi:hypothetical protein